MNKLEEDRRKDFRDVLDELDRYLEDFEDDLQKAVRKGMDSAFSQSNPFIAGFSFRMNESGKPTMQFFGSNPLRSNGFVSPITEQIVDEKAKTLRVVIDLPGVAKPDIKIDAAHDGIVVTAENETRKYRAEFGFKVEVEPESAKADYKNGVLEILFSLKDKANKDYRRVDLV